MKNKMLIIAALTLVGCITTSTIDWRVSPEEAKETPEWMTKFTRDYEPNNEIAADNVPRNLKLFLLIGQSNMAGRGTLDEADRAPIPDCYKLGRDNKWQLATSPLHFDRNNAGYGIANTFVRRYLADHPGERVGLIPCAIGGSASGAWSPEMEGKGTVGANFRMTLKRAAIAREWGEIVGILWHQGEGDQPWVMKQGGDYYPIRLAAMVEGFRRELNLPRVPFVFGEIGNLPEQHCKVMNPLIRRAVPLILDSALVPAEDLTGSMPDGVHFDTPSYRTLGNRYYDAWKRIVR